MRRLVWFIAAATLAVPASAWCQQNDQPPPAQNQAQSPTSDQPAQGQAAADATPPDSLAEAARKAREQKKEAPKSAKVFTNDNVPSEGGISTVGEGSAPANATGDTSAQAPATGTANDEKSWRAKFAELNHKLEQDQASLEVMQRELGQLNVQYYSDPMKAMQQELTRSDINNKVADIDKMKAQIEVDKQAISDAEDELRKSGGDPGWAR